MGMWRRDKRPIQVVETPSTEPKRARQVPNKIKVQLQLYSSENGIATVNSLQTQKPRVSAQLRWSVYTTQLVPCCESRKTGKLILATAAKRFCKKVIKLQLQIHDLECN